MNESNRISPKRFWDVTKDAITLIYNKDREKFKNAYNSNLTLRNWTVFFYELIETVRDRLGYNKDWHFYKEYLRLDYSMFSYDRDDVNSHIWHLEVAIEHENNPKTWLHEFVKLVHVNAGLKVLFCYTEESEDFIYQFKKLTDIYNSCKYKQRDDQILLIVGPLDLSKGSICGYSFNMLEGWQKLEGEFSGR